MHEIKDTQRSVVRIGFDGRVHKRYRGQMAKERFENEVRVLKYLEEKGCEFVPRLLEEHPEELYIVTTNCGQLVQRISSSKEKEIFSRLENEYGVRHDDAFTRNITYSHQLGCFCVIDFEFAVITATGEGLTLDEALKRKREEQEREQ